MMRKKLPAALPAMILSLSLALILTLAACGGEEASSPASEPSGQEIPSQSAPSESPSPESEPESAAPDPQPGSAPEAASQPASQPESVSSQPPAAPSQSQTAPAEPMVYRGEEVREVWALDVTAHTTVPYVPGGEGQPDQDRLEAALNDAPEASSGDAFLLFTQGGRHYLYLGEDPSGELSSLWEQVYNSREGKNIHWLTHMTPEKIAGITASVGELHQEEITGRQALDEIAAWLKENLTVDASKEIHVSEGPNNPDARADGYLLTIDFDTGVSYTLIGYGELSGAPDPEGTFLSVYTSDLDQTVYYTLEPGCAAALRSFFASLP